jgi:hypothetical protein
MATLLRARVVRLWDYPRPGLCYLSSICGGCQKSKVQAEVGIAEGATSFIFVAMMPCWRPRSGGLLCTSSSSLIAGDPLLPVNTLSAWQLVGIVRLGVCS